MDNQNNSQNPNNPLSNNNLNPTAGATPLANPEPETVAGNPSAASQLVEPAAQTSQVGSIQTQTVNPVADFANTQVPPQQIPAALENPQTLSDILPSKNPAQVQPSNTKSEVPLGAVTNIGATPVTLSDKPFTPQETITQPPLAAPAPVTPQKSEDPASQLIQPAPFAPQPTAADTTTQLVQPAPTAPQPPASTQLPTSSPATEEVK